MLVGLPVDANACCTAGSHTPGCFYYSLFDSERVSTVKTVTAPPGISYRQRMPLLIDGYNLLHVSGIIGRGIGPGGLHRSRMALLNFLAESLAPEELPRTTVVFDSHDAPWGLPQRQEHRGIVVRFAAKYESADELLEELIRADSAPRRLTVVSSDHRIQQAAKHRKAKPVDSDVWFSQLLHDRRERQAASPNPDTKPPTPLLAEDVEYWIRQFGDDL